MWNILKYPGPLLACGLATIFVVVIAGRAFADDVVQVAQVKAPSPSDTFDAVPITETDMVLGRADAPVTIFEYASLTCSHCAQFHGQVLPMIKQAYIDTGKAKLIFRDFPLDRLALAGSMLARCAGKQRYFGFIGLLFRDQARWSQSRNPIKSLGQLARLGGISQKKFDACLKDEAIKKVVLDQRLAGGRGYKIKSTPTVIINGRKYDGGLTFDQVRAVIEPILSKN